MEKIIIYENIEPGQEVFTGIPGNYETAPEAPGLYNFVEYAKVEEGQLVHVCFEWEQAPEKMYTNPDTGETWTEEEAKEAAKQFYFEAGHESPEKYFDYMLDNGMIKEI